MTATDRLCCALSFAVLALMPLAGCARYHAPGAAARMSVFGVSEEARQAQTDASIQELLDLEPLAQLPTVIAVAHVQDRGYTSHSYSGWGRGAYSVVTQRTVETDEHFERLRALPSVAGVAPVSRIILPGQLRSDRELRQAAAALHADMLLIYTFDTTFEVEGGLGLVDTLTLGLLPAKSAHVRCTASAALLDTRNGYFYGVAEASAKTSQLANAWTSRDAVEQSRLRAEQRAFDNLVTEFEALWPGVAARFTAREEPDGADPLAAPAVDG